MENFTSMKKNKCVELNCPFIPHCRYYENPDMFLNNCIHADQIAIRTKYYLQQIRERNEKWKYSIISNTQDDKEGV